MYRLLVPLRVTVEVGNIPYTVGLDLSEVPPFVDSWLTKPGDVCGLWLGRYETVEHAFFHFSRGYEVECPSLLELCFDRLVSEGRAELVAGRHMELRWRVGELSDGTSFDKYYDWNFSEWHAASDHCVFARSWLAELGA